MHGGKGVRKREQHTKGQESGGAWSTWRALTEDWVQPPAPLVIASHFASLQYNLQMAAFCLLFIVVVFKFSFCFLEKLAYYNEVPVTLKSPETGIVCRR